MSDQFSQGQTGKRLSAALSGLSARRRAGRDKGPSRAGVWLDGESCLTWGMGLGTLLGERGTGLSGPSAVAGQC